MSDEAIPEGINALPDPNAFAAPPDAQRRKRKRRDLVEPEPLAITSLMDIMTIILVFLLKSYSANPVQLKGGDDLKLPFSTADQEPAESAAITVTLNNILVTDDSVAKLERGEVSESDLSAGGFMIDPLFEALQKEVDKQKKIEKYNKKAKFTELVTIIADRNVPFSLLSKVMYTAGQASFSKFKFAVVKRST